MRVYKRNEANDDPNIMYVLESMKFDDSGEWSFLDQNRVDMICTSVSHRVLT